MEIRRRLARWLCPEAFKNEARYHFLLTRVRELEVWCNYDFPLIGEAARWALHATTVHFMPYERFKALVAEARYKEALSESIDEFRERLRREHGART